MVDWSLRIINTYHIYLGWLMVDGWLATLVAESHLRLGSPQPRGQLRLVLEEFLAQGWEAWREPSDTSAEDTVFQDVKSLSKLMDDDIYDHVCISIWWIYIYIMCPIHAYMIIQSMLMYYDHICILLRPRSPKPVAPWISAPTAETESVLPGERSALTLGHRQATLESHVGISWHLMGFYGM